MIKLRLIITAIVLICLHLNVIGQIKQLTSADAVGLNREIAVSKPMNLQWIGNEKAFSKNISNALFKRTVSTDICDTIINLSTFNRLLADIGVVEKAKYIPFGRWINGEEYMFKYNNSYMLFNAKTKAIKTVVKYAERAENLDVSNQSFNAAYTVANNLYAVIGGKYIQITDEPDGVVCGQTVHRNEFGINKGTFWSHNGQKLAYYKMDERMVSDYPLVDVNSRVAQTNNIKYPMAGMKIHEVELLVYDVETGSQTLLQTGEPREQYLTSVTWDPTGKYVYVGLLNRGQNHLKLNKYDVANGKLVKTLFEEHNDRWVEPEHGLFFNPAEPDKFVWLSERDGFNHAYYYNTNGDMLDQITSGKWVITNFNGFDEKGKHIYFISTQTSPIDEQLFSVNIKTKKVTPMTPEKGMHSAIVHPSGEYVIDSYSNLETPNITQLLDAKGKVLYNIKATANPLAGYNVGTTTIGTLKSSLGDELYYRLITPPNFDASKRYPVLIYVYGGPHAQMINNSWLGAGGLYLQYLASLGYVVFTLDNHGTPNRGFEFESIIHRNVGKQEVADQMMGVEFLKSLPYIDSSRIGVDGWSYGGFMTLSLILENPDVFKSASAGGPVCDWSLYEAMYGERYMDTPDENPEGYKAANSVDKIGKLKTKLLLNHGYIDDVVVPQHSLKLLDAAVKNNIQLDFFFYPNHPHNVRGKDRVHLIDKIVEFHNRELM